MAETVSRGTSTRLQTPTSPFILSSDDDQIEREQARAAAVRLRAMSSDAYSTPPPPDDLCLSKQRIIQRIHDCIKLATENKLNEKNIWELKLIDHLSEIIIRVEADHLVADMDFQKASCALEAGVKIYSLRVDSVHSEAYKVLGRIIRAVGEETAADIDMSSGLDECHSKKEMERKISPLSTLVPYYEDLNVKKFHVAFAVDRLYHQTSAQFDGGAKGLLLNNLGVYGGCRLLYDSLEVPMKCVSCSIQNVTNTDMIDITFVKEYIDQMVINLPWTNKISPTRGATVYQFEEECQKFAGGSDTTNDSNFELDGKSFANYGERKPDHDEQVGVLDKSFDFGETTFMSYHEENDPCTSYEPDADMSDKVALYLFRGLGFTSYKNAWAGPDHWKYWKSKGSEDVPVVENRSCFHSKRSKSNKKAPELDIAFTDSLDEEKSDIFAPPKIPKALLVPAKRVPRTKTLPEDFHYQLEDLIKLFLLPNVKCFCKTRRRLSDDNSGQRSNDFNKLFPSWDNENDFGSHHDRCFYTDLENSASLVLQPHQVNKIETHYDEISKQSEIHVLKETLWDRIQESSQEPGMVYKDAISFKHVLATFPDGCRAAVPVDISPHLCFICLLHLANEHCLIIRDCPTLNDLSIQLPFRC